VGWVLVLSIWYCEFSLALFLITVPGRWISHHHISRMPRPVPSGAKELSCKCGRLEDIILIATTSPSLFSTIKRSRSSLPQRIKSKDKPRLLLFFPRLQSDSLKDRIPQLLKAAEVIGHPQFPTFSFCHPDLLLPRPRFARLPGGRLIPIGIHLHHILPSSSPTLSHRLHPLTINPRGSSTANARSSPGYVVSPGLVTPSPIPAGPWGSSPSVCSIGGSFQLDALSLLKTKEPLSVPAIILSVHTYPHPAGPGNAVIAMILITITSSSLYPIKSSRGFPRSRDPKRRLPSDRASAVPNSLSSFPPLLHLSNSC